MKHITFSDKSLLVGDEAADLLLEYGAALMRQSSGDTVELHSISSDGDEVVASFLLGSGAPLMAETTTSQLPEPDNAEAVGYMRDRIRELDSPREALPFDDAPDDTLEEDYRVE
jgi:hypothetical protein